MKRVTVILAIITLLFPGFVKGYSNNLFSIKMPEGYELTLEENGVYQWINSAKTANLVVSIDARENEKKLLDYNVSEKEAYIKEVKNRLESQYLSKYNMNVAVALMNAEQKKFNSYQSFSLKFEIEKFLLSDVDINQYLYVIETDNLRYTIVYTIDKKEYNEKEFKNIENSFKVYDKSSKGAIIDTIETIYPIGIGLAIGILATKIDKEKVLKGIKKIWKILIRQQK
jgi:hypothetical protein